jgi:hypothetical protein
MESVQPDEEAGAAPSFKAVGDIKAAIAAVFS